MNVTAIWLRRIGPDIQVLTEVDGQWRLVINELWDGNISHIVEKDGIADAPPESLRALAYGASQATTSVETTS